jgi:hypothetical protein
MASAPRYRPIHVYTDRRDTSYLAATSVTDKPAATSMTA